jgi:cellulose synthase/poly-beta-1,6-N-acetylglucosamine synthase-like glycosyltransferase
MIAFGLTLALLGALNLLAALALFVLSRPFDRQKRPLAAAMASLEKPFISVHVATHDEPPALVIATIEALTKLDYPAFEIVVIDNNTVDHATWEPVAQRARELGPTVRFFHREGVRGAKAGALNIALELTDPRASCVAIVDADYIVTRDFLTRAMAAFNADVQFVQFPQDYRHAAGAAAVVAELSDYFDTFPHGANRAQATLLTGTLSVISVAALRAAGGWPTSSITEDAELGVKLWGRQARGLFVPNKVGLLPLNLAGLRLQRQRWVTGNVQTLLRAGSAIVATPTGALAVIAQLTAWTGLLALPLLSLVIVAALRAFATSSAWPWPIVEGMAVCTILCVLAGHLIRALTRQRPASIAVTLALLWTSSFAWLAILSPWPLRFKRTPKAVPAIRRSGPSLDTVGGVISLVTAVTFAIDGAPLTAIALALCASGLAAAPLVDRWLRRAAAAPQEMSCAV